MTWHTYAVAVGLVGFVARVSLAIQSWNTAEVALSDQPLVGGGALPALDTESVGISDLAPLSNEVPSTEQGTLTTSVPPGTVAPGAPGGADLTICAYVTYQTAQCPGRTDLRIQEKTRCAGRCPRTSTPVTFAGCQTGVLVEAYLHRCGKPAALLSGYFTYPPAA